ncbi:MAG: carboxypeptidase regulatory-like domain-containing protein, partial [Limisphaerales bacterium]
IIGPGIYLNHASNAIVQMRMTREPSPAGNYGKGVAGYSYQVPTVGDVPRSTFFAALTQPGISYTNGTPIDSNPTPIFAQPATIPPMPWKVAPTKGHIKGFVFAGAEVFDGATVTLQGPTSKTVTNDGTGFYGFVDLAPGSYTLRATAPGFGLMQTNVTVSAGVVRNADLQLNPHDTIAPRIWDVTVADKGDTWATITWRTDERSSSLVEYGTGSNLGQSASDPALVKLHSVTLSNLTQRTGYMFRVKSTDPSGNETTSELFSFMTYHEGFVPDIIIDNPQAKVTGSWSTGTIATDKYGDDYRFRSQGSGANHLEYRPTILSNGTYAVYAWYPQGSNRATNAPYVINFDGGSATIRVDQRTNGGKWNLLGEFNFKAGTNGYVRITDGFTGGGSVMADAVKFASVPPPIDIVVDNVEASFQGTWYVSTGGTKYGADYNYAPSVSVGGPTH